MWLILFLNSIYASTFIFGKMILDMSSPVFFTGLRFLAAGFLSMIIFFVRDYNAKTFSKIDYKDWSLIFVVALFNVYLNNALEFWGLQFLPSGKAAFLYNMSPFFSAFFSYVFFFEKMTLKKWAGFLIGFFSFLPIIMGEADVTDTTMHFWFISLAELAVFFAAIVISVGSISIKMLVKRKRVSTFLLNGSSMMIGGCLSFVHAALFEKIPFVQEGCIASVLGFALLFMCINVVTYNMNSYLLKSYSVTFISFSWFLIPMIATFMGWVFLHEPISIQLLLSTAGVGLGLFIFYQEELRQGYIVK